MQSIKASLNHAAPLAEGHRQQGKTDGAAETHLIALACSEPSQGRARI